MVIPGATRTAEEWEIELGRQVRELRLRLNRTQQNVAREANISVSTLQNLEYGAGSSLKSFVQVARALGRADWLHGFAPPVTVSPMQMLRDRQSQDATRRLRARARAKRS